VIRIIYFVFSFLLLVLFLFPLACANNPSSPSSSIATFTSTKSPTSTQILTATVTPSQTTTNTALFTNTPTNSSSNTPINSMTQTATATETDTQTLTSTSTNTPTNSPSAFPTNTWTSTFTDTFTPTATATIPMGIFIQSGVQTMGSGIFVFANLLVNQTREGGDLVILNIPNGSPITLSCGSCSPSEGYGYTGPPNFQPAGNYSMSVSTSIGTAISAVVSGPGGNIGIDPSGSPVTWLYEGNADFLQVTSGGVTTFDSTISVGPDIDSPFSMPAEAYPSSGNYVVYVFPVNKTFTFTGTPGAAINSFFYAADMKPVSITK